MTDLLVLCLQLTLGGWGVVRGVSIHEYGLLRSLQVPFQLLIFYSASDRWKNQDWTCVESNWQRKFDLFGETPSMCRFAHHKFYAEGPGIKCGGLCWERWAANRLIHGTALWDMMILCSLVYWSQILHKTVASVFRVKAEALWRSNVHIEKRGACAGNHE